MEAAVLPDGLLRGVRSVALLWIGRLGDLVVSTPLLLSVRRRFPEARVTLVCGEGNAEAAALCEGPDEALTLRRWTCPLSNARLAWRLASSPPDLLVDLNTAHSRASAALARLSRSRVRLALDKGRCARAFTHLLPPAGEREHMLDRYARLARALGAPYEPVTRVAVPEQSRRRAAELFAGLWSGGTPAGLSVLVHPGNFRKFDNRWPEEKFAALCRLLLARGGVRLAFLAGPGEQAPVRALASAAGNAPVAGPLPVSAAAALLERFDLFLDNATGTAHLAAAVGTPTFCLLGRYTKTVWMPRTGPHYCALSDSWESCRGIPVEDAWRALESALGGLRPRSG